MRKQRQIRRERGKQKEMIKRYGREKEEKETDKKRD